MLLSFTCSFGLKKMYCSKASVREFQKTRQTLCLEVVLSMMLNFKHCSIKEAFTHNIVQSPLAEVEQ